VSDVTDPVADAARKAGVLWIGAPGHAPVPAWQVWRDGATYVLTGPGEQALPGLAGAAECTVVARSAETGGRAATWTARVERLAPGTEEWDAIRPALAAGRLNGHPDWETAVVLRLTPTAA
jgi:hypothetical protein